MDVPPLVLIKKFSLLFLLGLFLPSGASEMCETERGWGWGEALEGHEGTMKTHTTSILEKLPQRWLLSDA